MSWPPHDSSRGPRVRADASRGPPGRPSRSGRTRGGGPARAWLLPALIWLIGPAPRAGFAAEPADEFAQGTTALGLQIGGGAQNNVERHRTISEVSFVGVMPRVSYLPFAPFGDGWLKSAVEHISNGNTSSPNRGVNSNSGVLGLSYYFH